MGWQIEYADKVEKEKAEARGRAVLRLLAVSIAAFFIFATIEASSPSSLTSAEHQDESSNGWSLTISIERNKDD